tara:strand:- start:212 stop:739 length:528 start_codon:yes stop_codon:yes gene_type:complete
MNKIIVSVVLTLILVVGINKMTDVIYNVQKPEKSAYQVASTTTATSTTEEKVSQDSQTGDIMALLASASVADGEKVFKKCAACHSIAKGGSNKIGPALYNVLGRPAGSLPDYKYSKAMVAHGKIWTAEEMNGFLIKPKDWIKGTKMSYAGLKSAEERAAVIVFMNKNSDNPIPLQ